MACAQCHTHKYDPITQTEYFQIFDFFNQSQDADRQDEAPIKELWNNAEDGLRRDDLRKKLATLESSLKLRHVELEEAFLGWIKELQSNKQLFESLPDSLKSLSIDDPISDDVRKKLLDHYHATTPLLADLRNDIEATRKQLSSLKPITTLPIMQDLAEQDRRKTFVQLRGNYQSLGEQVTANTPAVFGALQSDAPKNRLSLAKWLVSRENPLTARVVVNRYWNSSLAQDRGNE